MIGRESFAAQQRPFATMRLPLCVWYVYVRCMATKTISIDLEAYRALRRRKRAGQSFSDVIKEHFSGGISAEHFAVIVRDAEVSEQTLDTLDDLIERRRADPAGVPEF